MKIVYYRDRKGHWRWRAVARNGRIVAESGEGYKRMRDAVKGVERTFDVIRCAHVQVIK